MLENVENMTFNDVDLAAEFTGPGDAYFVVNEVRGRGVLPEVVDLVHVQGMDGAHLSGKTTPERVIEIDITLKGESVEDLRERIERLNSILHSEKEVAISFADEPDRTYFGTLADVSYRAEISHIYQATLVIICPDPYKYGPELTADFPSDTVIVENPGTADADPIFELTAKEQTTFATVSNGEQYMMVGSPVDVDDFTYPRLSTILNDNCSSLVGWTAIPNGTALDTGIVGGTMHVQGGYAFAAETYGTNPDGWVGPAIVRSLSEQVQDFRCEIRIGAFNTYGDVGSIELHLRDENSNTVAILAMRDSTARYAENRAVVQLGQAGNRHSLLNYNGGYRATWNDFSGIIRLEREGNNFHAHVAVVEEGTGRHIRRHTTDVFTDTLGHYSAKIAQVVVYIAKAKTYDPYGMLMNNIYVGRINEQTGIPYIADEGDVITFDHVTRDCYINGEPVPFDFGADFFKLVPGENNLALLPDNTFDASVKFRPKYR